MVAIGKHRAEFGAAAEEAGGFAIGKIGGLGFSEIDAIETSELEKFAFDHVLREADENVENGEIALLEGDFEGLHVKPVPGEDAHVIAPAGIGGRAAAASVRAIDDVVVDEGGAVDHLDDSAERNGSGALIAAGAGSEKKQRGTKALAAALAEIASDFGDGLDGFAGLGSDLALDEDEVVTNQVKNFANGQDGDDSLHGLRLNCKKKHLSG